MERKVNIDKIEDADIKIKKVKDLLGYFIEQEYSSTNPVDTEESEFIQNYVLTIKYHDTQNILDIIFDYLISIQDDIKNVIDNSSKEN